MAVEIKPKIRHNKYYTKYVKVKYRIYDPKKMYCLEVVHEEIDEEILKEIFKAQREIGNIIQRLEYKTTI